MIRVRAWRPVVDRTHLWVGVEQVSHWLATERTVVIHPLPVIGLVITLGEPLCWCGRDPEEGRHQPLAECATYQLKDGTMGCPAPHAHHAFRVAPLWRRTSTELVVP